MDQQHFDQLTKVLASGRTRRQLLRGLLGLGAIGAGTVLRGPVEAARRGTSGPTVPTPAPTIPPAPPTPVPEPTVDPCAGMNTCSRSGCCDGNCTSNGNCCAAGRSVCGPDCCTTPEQCCDNACCPDGTICIGEETCCPYELMCGGICCLSGTCLGGACCDAAFVCGDTCCTAEGYQCCDGSCRQCCSDDDCAATSYCNEMGFCVPGCNEDSDCADLSSECLAGTCRNNACVAVDTCDQGHCCNGVCSECCGSDISTCPDNKCISYVCQGGACQSESEVDCSALAAIDCFSPGTCNPATGQCEDQEYLGDGATCGAPSGEVSAGICCNRNCVARDNQNCSACGDVCAAEASCIDGACRCPDNQIPCDGSCLAESCCPSSGAGCDPLACESCSDAGVCTNLCTRTGTTCGGNGECVCLDGLYQCEPGRGCYECCQDSQCTGEHQVCHDRGCCQPTLVGTNMPLGSTCPDGSQPMIQFPDAEFVVCFPEIFCESNDQCCDHVCSSTGGIVPGFGDNKICTGQIGAPTPIPDFD